MKIAARFMSKRMFLAKVAFLVAWSSVHPALAAAQGSQGQNAVYNNSNTGGWPGLSRSLRRPGLFSRHSQDARVGPNLASCRGA
jgi:hypothetical protein